MKTKKIFWALGMLAIGLLNQCKTPVPGPDLNRVWKAQEVKEGTAVVYRAGSSSNIYPGYSNYRMKFGASNVEFTELSGEMFAGTWLLADNNSKLTFSALMPVPYGTGGTIEFTLVRWEANKLVLKRGTPNQKTGGTVNEYTLVPE